MIHVLGPNDVPYTVVRTADGWTLTDDTGRALTVDGRTFYETYLQGALPCLPTIPANRGPAMQGLPTPTGFVVFSTGNGVGFIPYW